MGCDIHSLIQVKEYGEGPWVTVEKRVNGDPRDYDMFAILANVRNGYGFAGLTTGQGFIPIAQPKGFPQDTAVTDGEHIDGLWMGDHSHSWLTLSEMLEYLKTCEARRTKKCGVISWRTYLVWRKTGGYPESYSAAVSGPGIRTVSTDEAERLVLDNFKEKFSGPFNDDPALVDRVYVKVSWEIAYGDVENFIGLVERMRQVARNFGTRSNDEVRLVFGFDS